MEEINTDTVSPQPEAWSPPPAAVITMVTGYQWGDDLSYIGTYQITSIEGQEVHVPPRTTLQAPAHPAPIGMEYWFDVEADAWKTREEDLSWMDPATRAMYLAGLAAAAEEPV